VGSGVKAAAGDLLGPTMRTQIEHLQTVAGLPGVLRAYRGQPSVAGDVLISTCDATGFGLGATTMVTAVDDDRLAGVNDGAACGPVGNSGVGEHAVRAPLSSPAQAASQPYGSARLTALHPAPLASQVLTAWGAVEQVQWAVVVAPVAAVCAAAGVPRLDADALLRCIVGHPGAGWPSEDEQKPAGCTPAVGVGRVAAGAQQAAGSTVTEVDAAQPSARVVTYLDPTTRVGLVVLIPSDGAPYCPILIEIAGHPSAAPPIQFWRASAPIDAKSDPLQDAGPPKPHPGAQPVFDGRCQAPDCHTRFLVEVDERGGVTRVVIDGPICPACEPDHGDGQDADGPPSSDTRARQSRVKPRSGQPECRGAACLPQLRRPGRRWGGSAINRTAGPQSSRPIQSRLRSPRPSQRRRPGTGTAFR
jgi:hypothetical protein